MAKTDYLLPGQVELELRNDRAVEQWLGHVAASGGRILRWLRVEPDRSGHFSVALLECFDDGNPNYLDIYAFEPTDPDALGGVIDTFGDPESAVAFAIRERGAAI